MKESINIIGAFDRYNYGDVLFPIIIEEYLKLYRKDLINKYELKFFGLIESDLSNIGGKETVPLKELYDSNIDEKSIIMVAGGDVLPAQLSNMDIDLSINYFSMIIKKIFIKIFGREVFEKISMRRFGINTKYPWIVDRSKLKNSNVNIFYNSVGGAVLNRVSDYDLSYIKQKLSECNYLSVRDIESKNNLGELNPILAPDSASIMSVFFDNSRLEESISKDVYNFVKNTSSYICIQTNLFSIANKNNEDKLVEEITKIKNKTNTDILLLPIGIAANHDDNIALNKIKKRLKFKVTHFENLNIYDIMYCIANSDFFAGTSLHGNITAMSYSVPHIGLNKEIKKLDQYLNSWDIEEQNGCIDMNDLYEYYIKSTIISKEKLINKREEVVNLVMKNFQKMFSVLGEI